MRFTKRLCLLGFVSCFILLAKAQQLDSLTKQLEACTVDSLRANLLNEIAKIAFVREQYEKAFKLCEESASIYHRIGDRANEAYVIGNMGSILLRMQQWKEAEKYYLRALAIKEEIGDKRGQALTCSNIASNCYEHKEYQKGINYALRGLSIAIEIKDTVLMASTKTGLGNIYMDLMKYDLAYKEQRDAYVLYQAITDTVGMALSLANIGEIELRKENFIEGIKIYHQALQLTLAGNIEDGRLKSIIYEGLYNGYKGNGESDKALDYLEKVFESEQRIWNEELIGKIAQVKENYEAEKREQDILLLEEQNKTANALAEKRKLWPLIIGIISVGLLIALGLIVFILIQQNRHQKRIREMELVKTKAELEQKVLRAQMNPHFIFNSLNSIQHYILSNQTQYAYDYLARFSTLIRRVLMNSEHSTITLEKEIELLGIYIELEQKRFQNRFAYEINYDKNLAIDQIEVPVMLIQPFVENAIWHGIMNLAKDRKGHLKIGFVVDAGTLKITVEDNGIGRKAARKLKKNDEYDSVGMLFSEKRLEMIKLVSGKNSKIMVTDLYNEDGSAKGTKVDIILPI